LQLLGSWAPKADADPAQKTAFKSKPTSSARIPGESHLDL
jgi:hypothetical protein